MNLLDLDFPQYRGLESQYEYIIYNYLYNILRQRGYILRIKKTNLENIDKNIESVSGNGGNGVCDGYILTDNSAESLFALLELESNEPRSKLEDGVKQLKIYANSLSSKYKIGEFKCKYKVILLMAYDGEYLYLSEFDLYNGTEKCIIGSSNPVAGEKIDNSLKLSLFDNFKETNNNYFKLETTEKGLIRTTKEILRQNKNLQVNKAYILTVLSSIYGQTKKTHFDNAIEQLKIDAENGKTDAQEMKRRWEQLLPKIDYDKNKVKQGIKRLYEEVAISLYIVSQDKKLDLYGFIYEELAEKNNKKEDGEYYTPRHHIRPIINSVFNKYLKRIWGITNSSEKNYDILKERIILDPFCGSGGFLYEFLKLLKSEYNYSNSTLNNIAKCSIIGFDKNDIMAAYFNLFLIGDGKSKIYEVQSSINWQNVWKYVIKDDKAIEIQDKKELMKSISNSVKTFKCFLSVLIDIRKIKQDFSIDSLDMRDVQDIEEFITKDEELSNQNIQIDDRYSFFDRLILDNYKSDKECVLKLVYDSFKAYSSNPSIIPEFSEFVKCLGAVDYLATNVPYGNIDDIRYKNGFGSRLESVALKECIDLLKPSSVCKGYYDDTRFITDENGAMYSNNDGGIATIIIPNGILERNESELRDYLFKRCKILSIIKLPFYTFSPYALVQTYVITIQKKSVFEFQNDIQDQNVFLYIADNDGKANSDKRYPTMLINSIRTEIKNRSGQVLTNVHEFLHDELEKNLEKYPEGYLSKLERAWIFGNSITVSLDWNQKRYTEIWDGEKWEDINDTKLKWKYEKLQKKVYKKQVEKKSSKLSELIIEIADKDENFSDLDIAEQKDIILKSITEKLLEPIKSIERHGNNIILQPKLDSINNPMKIPNKTNLMNYIKMRYVSDFIYDEKNIEIFKDDLYKNNKLEYTKETNDLICLLDDIAEIFIDANKEVTLYIDEEYEEYDLVPEHYLIENQKGLSIDEILNSIRRLKGLLQNKKDSLVYEGGTK